MNVIYRIHKIVNHDNHYDPERLELTLAVELPGDFATSTWVNALASDGLAPCVAKSSVAIGIDPDIEVRVASSLTRQSHHTRGEAEGCGEIVESRVTPL